MVAGSIVYDWYIFSQEILNKPRADMCVQVYWEHHMKAIQTESVEYMEDSTQTEWHLLYRNDSCQTMEVQSRQFGIQTDVTGNKKILKNSPSRGEFVLCSSQGLPEFPASKRTKVYF